MSVGNTPVPAPLAAAMALGAVLAPVASGNEASLFGNVTVSFAVLRWRVAAPAPLDGFAPVVAAAVVRGFFTGPVVLPSDSFSAALAAVSRGFLEEVLFDCIIVSY